MTIHDLTSDNCKIVLKFENYVVFGYETSGFVCRLKGHGIVCDGGTASGYGGWLQIQADRRIHG